MNKYCIKCKKGITEDEYSYSMRYFQKALCREHQPTEEAKRLGFRLREIGWNVEFERYDGYKNVDISIPDAKVDIEVDGLQHSITKKQALIDIKRAYYSYRKGGFFTLHVPNILVQDDMVEEAAQCINIFLEDNYKDVKDNWFVGFIRKLFNNNAK
jgi:very-short-patch-repair endonuclease